MIGGAAEGWNVLVTHRIGGRNYYLGIIKHVALMSIEKEP